VLVLERDSRPCGCEDEVADATGFEEGSNPSNYLNQRVTVPANLAAGAYAYYAWS